MPWTAQTAPWLGSSSHEKISSCRSTTKAVKPAKRVFIKTLAKRVLKGVFIKTLLAKPAPCISDGKCYNFQALEAEL